MYKSKALISTIETNIDLIAAQTMKDEGISHNSGDVKGVNPIVEWSATEHGSWSGSRKVWGGANATIVHVRITLVSQDRVCTVIELGFDGSVTLKCDSPVEWSTSR